MDDEEEEINRRFLQAQKLEEYKNQLLESIRRASPRVNEALPSETGKKRGRHLRSIS